MNCENYLYLLGPVRVERVGKPVQGFESRRALALLCYLAAQGQPQPRAHLADLFWPDKSEARGRGNLSRVLHNLHTLLPGCVTADREMVTFNAAACWLDTTAFVTLTASPADAIALTEAAALYRDDLLAGLYLDDCPDFETWLVIERERWRQKIAAVLHTLIAHHTHRGEVEAGLHHADRLLALDPWREEAHRHKMLLLALAGQRSAALKQYAQCRQMLADELGVVPAAETEALYRRLRDGATLDAGKPPEGHAAPLTLKTLPLVGRADAHAWLLAHWDAARRADGDGLTLLAGSAGVGKTRLIHEVARLIAGQGGLTLTGRCYEFNRAVPYQALHEALRLHLERLPAAARRALPPAACRDLAWLLPEVSPHAPPLIPPERAALFAAVAALLRAWTPPRGLALFLDDLHWADDDTLDLLHSLVHTLVDLPCWWVGTYRPEETPPDHPLSRLQHSLDRDGLLHCHTLSPLTEQDVAQLTARLLAAQERAPLAAYLYRESAGNPFIITEVLAALRDQGQLIPAAAGWEWQGDGTGLTLPDRVQDIILQRTARLGETSHYLLTLVAAYGRPFDGALLAAAGDCAPEEVAAALAEWQTRQLVRPVDAAWDFAHDNIRSALYQNVPAPLRRLLHARLAAALEAHAPAEVALLAYHSDQAQRPAAVRYLLQAGDQARQTYAHEQALAAYRRGLELASAPELRYALLNGLENVYDMAGRRAEQRAALDALAALVTDGPPELHDPRRQIEVALRQARYAEATGDYPTAAVAAERAVALALVAGDEALLAAGYRQWGYALRRQEAPPPAARALYERARVAAARAGAKPVLTDALQGLANVAWNQGEYAAAQGYLEQSLVLCQELGDRRGEADAYNIMGIVAQRQRDYLQARDYYTRALDLRRTIGDRRAQGLSHNNLGGIAYELGDDTTAETAYGEAAMLCREADDHWGTAIAALGLSWVALDQGKFDLAQQYAEEGLVGLQQVGAHLRIAQAEYTLGLIAQAQGNIETALAHITRATATWRHPDRSEPLVMGLSTLAQLWAARGDAEQARAELAEALIGLERDPLLPGVTRPLRAHWHCYQALVILNDPRAGAVLNHAHVHLYARAAQLPGTIADVFLSQIPEHRAILAASNQTR